MAQSEQSTTTGLRLVVRGQVAAVTRKETKSGTIYLTLLKTPAPDQYATPGTFEVRSKRAIGQKGTEVEVECDLLGYSRSYENKAGETVRTAEHVLQAA